MKKRKENGLENWVLSELWCDIVRSKEVEFLRLPLQQLS
jgi:hypothetical protein